MQVRANKNICRNIPGEAERAKQEHNEHNVEQVVGGTAASSQSDLRVDWVVPSHILQR